MAASQGELTRPAGRVARLPDGSRRWLFLAVVVFGGALALYALDLVAHGLMNWFDLGVYRDVGHVAQTDPSRVYVWELAGRKFTYTPFAALIFGALSWLPLGVLQQTVTVLSVATLPLIAWLMFGALGWQGTRRLAASLILAGVGLWLEPVQRAIALGQVEMLLMLLLVWDLCQPDTRRFKGIGVGLAAGIKLVPLLFIPYLLLAGKVRQAVVATAAFVATVVIGAVFLPRTLSSYWLSGYFLRPSGLGPIDGLRNQSIFGLLIKLIGTQNEARPVWLVVSAIVGAAGLLASVVLHRSGRPVAGWVTCSLTALLISPISWDHHWVWIVPILALVVDWAVRSQHVQRQACWALAGALVLLFGAYPNQLSGQHPYLPVGGLLGIVDHNPTAPRSVLLRPSMLLTWDLFVLIGLGLFALLLGHAWRVRHEAEPLPRRARARPSAGASGSTTAQPT
jgi:alpha-1,2-mannosyltransferase